MNKRILSLFVTALTLLTATPLRAQITNQVRMDTANNGTTITLSGGSLTVRDDDSQGDGAPYAGSYKTGLDLTLTISATCPAPQRIAVTVKELAVACLDTIYIYDGPTATGTPIIAFNSFTGNVSEEDIIFESPANTSGCITIRFVTDPRTDSTRTSMPCYQNNPGINKGFSFIIECLIPCEKVVPVIEDMFYRTRDGEIYDSSLIHLIEIYDTATGELTESFIGANLCIGDGVIFKGHGEYTHKYGYYNPTDATTTFHWDLGNEGDTMVDLNLTEIEYSEYQRTGCYDVSLRLVDDFGCKSSVLPMVRVRTAMNPIKTLYPLTDICNRDSLRVDIGYEGDNATLTLSKIQSDSSVSKTFISRVFIPDGPLCTDPYFEAPVTFEEFPPGRSVTSASDICSICINMEHSDIQDIYITLVCPTGQEALIKFGYGTPPAGLPAKTGLPGEEVGSFVHVGGYLRSIGTTKYDGSTGHECDSLYNPYGVGLDYCFSRDTAYYLVSGQRAGDVWSTSNVHPIGDFYIGSNNSVLNANIPITYPTIPTGFDHAGETPTAGIVTTRRPSNHEAKTNYYLPFTDFSELIGCPLNGEWKVRIYDRRKIDNGWIFNWSMDICDYSASGCDYQVAIDSMVWTPDPAPEYHDYDLGYYRGAVVHQETPLKSVILTPDTAGTFPILVHVYDEFGCQWDAKSQITSRWTPKPDLGPDTALCGINRMELVATDSHTYDDSTHYTFLWEPNGETTDTIMSEDNPGADVTYIVMVTNTQDDLECVTYDTIRVQSRRQPLPSIYPVPFVFEGCDPFTIHFENQSVDADQHLWIFGDGFTSTDRSPSHTYIAGNYDLKYYATSGDGCIDSIISPGSITVYTAPKAAFSWTPSYPSVTNPEVQFINQTQPTSATTHYYWEMQYNLDFPHSVETLTEENPTFDFTKYTEGNPAGNYSVRLIARSDNLAPTGNMIYCPDTTVNNILVVNDFLQFPNVVTPNDDGINDRFEIKNLIEGLAFPINSLDIYNKWGTRVYHKDNIASHDDFWDPTGMPTGTYYFRFSARGMNGSIEHNGTIEVIY